MTLEDVAEEKLCYYLAIQNYGNKIIKDKSYVGYDCTTSYSTYDELKILPYKQKFRRSYFNFFRTLTNEEVRQTMILLMFENITNDV